MAISKWFLCGHEGVFEKNEELAFKYAQRAAAGGLGTAEFAIGIQSDLVARNRYEPLLTYSRLFL